MPFYNSETLIRNITKLMQNNHMTQEDLANILGMSQSNVSKALSYKDKKAFTLDQVVGIAKHFNTSVDELLGLEQKAHPQSKLTLRAIGESLARMLEQHKAVITEIEKEEYIYYPDPNFDPIIIENDIPIDDEGAIYEENKIVKYPAIYFPQYTKTMYFRELRELEIKNPRNSEQYMPTEAAQAYGNENNSASLNEFLRKIEKILQLYDDNGFDEDAYNAVLQNYLSRIPNEYK